MHTSRAATTWQRPAVAASESCAKRAVRAAGVTSYHPIALELNRCGRRTAGTGAAAPAVAPTNIGMPSAASGFYSHITPGSVSLRLSALAAVRLRSRHRVIGRRRLSEAPLARTVRSNDILQVADALRNFGITALRGSPRSNGARPPRDTG
jgi:hypothetical protein